MTDRWPSSKVESEGARPPAIVVVDDEERSLRRTVEELEHRYAGDYAIRAHGSGEEAIDGLARARETGERVALVLCDQWMPGEQGDLLSRVRELHPLAKRGLLVDWGARGVTTPPPRRSWPP